MRLDWTLFVLILLTGAMLGLCGVAIYETETGRMFVTSEAR